MKKIYIYIFLLFLICISLFFNNKESYIDYDDNNVELIEREKSDYQTIELVKDIDTDKYCMLLNGEIQNHSDEVYLSHEAMVDISIKLCNESFIEKLLILGGGDGFPAMFALKHPDIKITNVEIDGELIKFTKNNKIMQELTHNSFNNKRVELYSQDAYEYINDDDNDDYYDIIIHDIEIKTGQDFEQKNREILDYNLIDNCLKDYGVFNCTDYIKNDKMKKLLYYYFNTIHLKKKKYNILLFQSNEDFIYLDSFLLFDLHKFKSNYPNSEIGVLIYNNDVYCGKLEYGEEFYFYVCKNKFRRDQNDIEFHKVILDEI